MNKFKILITGLLIGHSVFAQNLVPNGDFELYSVLPNDYGQSNRATGWNNVNGFYSGPPYASPDYFNTAGTVPTAFGQIAPFSGNGQMGFITNLFFIANFREYISTTLVSPLVAGMQYKVSFALSNGNNGEYTKSTNNIGVTFSTGPFFQLVDQPIAANPQIEIATITYNPNVWQTYTYFFTASGSYTHITIGNFRDDSNTLISPTGSSGAYYFIDSIVVEPSAPLPIELLSFTGKNYNKTNILHWSTSSETNNDYFSLEKSSDANTFHPIGKIKGAGHSTTVLYYSFVDENIFNGANYYRLRQTDFDGATSYSKIIPLISNGKNEIDFLIYPNPATNTIYLQSQNPITQITIKNILGEQIKAISGNIKSVDISNLPNGIYFITANTSKQQPLKTKFVVNR